MFFKPLSFYKKIKASGYIPTPIPTYIPSPTINFTIDIDPGEGNVYTTASSSQGIEINMINILPKYGIKIDINVKKNSDNTTVFNRNFNSNSSRSNITLNGLPLNQICTASVTVIDRSDPSNFLLKSFLIEYI